MGEPFVDKGGIAIKEGDILKYDEGSGFSQQIHEVVVYQGKLCGKTRIGEPRWSVVEHDEPIELQFYKSWPSSSDFTCIHTEVIGSVKEAPELLTVEHAMVLWPITPQEEPNA